MRKFVVVVAVVVLVGLIAAVVLQGLALAKADRDHSAELEGLQARVAQSDGQIATAQAEVESAQDSAAEARADSVELLDVVERAEKRLNAATTALARADSNVRRLRRDYNSLYSDFQRLYNLATVLVGQTSYQPSFSYDPIYCSSNTIGSYTYTNCY